MASDTVHDAIRDYLAGNSTTAAAWTTTPIAFENETADTLGRSVPPNPITPWIEIELEGWTYSQESLGASLQHDNRWDEEGLLSINVLVEAGAGASQGRQYAKAIADLFRGKTLLSGALEFGDTFILRGEPRASDGNWWLIPVKIEWHRVDA